MEKRDDFMENKLIEKMSNGVQVLGTFDGTGSDTIVEIMGYNQYDYVILDTEHGPYDIETAQRLIRTARMVDLPALVRVKDDQRNSILKMLDAGALGIIIPNVHTVDEVKEIVKYGKYAPIGQRGFGPNSGNEYLTAEYAQQGMDHYFNYKNKETLIIPQCETVGAAENIEEIVNTPGVDGIFIGPYDLSVALGVPGETTGPEVMAVVDRVLKACKEADKFSFIYTNSIEDTKAKILLGFDAVCYSMNVLHFSESAASIVKQLKGLDRNTDISLY